MTFYQELQLNQAGSKELIRNSQNNKEKLKHLAIYLFKIFITMVFCMAFVIIYSTLFGNANSIVGVVVLLFVLVFRKVDLSIKTSHALPSLLAIFAILAIGPRLSNASNLYVELLVNSVCIFLLLLIGCHNEKMCNHSTLVLGYLLLYGYDVSGDAYTKRLEAIAVGAIITGIVYFRNHSKKTYERNFLSFFQEFDINSHRAKWQLSLTFAISSILLIARIINLPRPMWAAIAVMSIITPFSTGKKQKAKERVLGNIVGTLLVCIIYSYCPEFTYNNIGIIGGIGVGLSATYGFQSVFNSFGAISAASTLLGFPAAIFFRVIDNVLGSVYGLVFNKYFCKFVGNRFYKSVI